MRKIRIFFVVAFLLTIFTSGNVSAITGPVAHLKERTTASFNFNGTYMSTDSCPVFGSSTNPCRYGYVQMGTPNTQDVLQYIRVNVTDTTDTSLNSETAYKGAIVSSSSPWDLNNLYVNSSHEGDDLDDDEYYNITNVDSAPVIQLSMSYSNEAGGEDLYDEDNIREYVSGYTSENLLSFNLTIENPSTTRALNGASLELQFNQDTGSGNEDIVDVTNVAASSGTPSSTNTDGDSQVDKISWSGDLGTSQKVYLTFNATTQSDVNFGDSNSMDLDGTDQGVWTNWTDSASDQVYFTQKDITGKFSKGPIRQGTDMAEQDTGWTIRGFIRNMGSDSGVANNITYNVTSWALYNVTDNGQLDMAVWTGNFDDTNVSNPSLITPSDGRVKTTDDRSSNRQWYDTGDTNKPYFATQFDWEVVWNSTNDESYSAYINASMDLPIMYKIDMTTTKDIAGILNPDTPDETITLNDTVKHWGSEEALVQKATIYSVVPGETTTGFSPDSPNATFRIDDTSVKVYFLNGSQYELDSANYDLNVTQPTSEGGDGSVNVTIVDTTSTLIGDYINNSEKLTLEYNVTTNYTTNGGDVFNFTGNTSFTTDTGTPITEAQTTEAITVSGKRLTGYKDLVASDPMDPTLISGDIVAKVTDTGATGVSGVKFIDYVPLGTDFDTSNVTVYKNGNPLTLDTDYQIHDNGTVELPSGVTAHAYEYQKIGGDWHLYDGDQINVSYDVRIDESGAYEMPASLVGVDPKTGQELRTTAFGNIRVEVPEPLKDFDISEGELEQAKRATIGNKVEWMKRFEVFNPNNRPARGSFETRIFDDAGKVFISYTKDNGERASIEGTIKKEENHKYVTWSDELNPMETRSYQIRVMTPVVIEVGRKVEVMEKISDKKVKLKMDVSLKNFAEEDYSNLVMNLPIPYESVMEVKNGFGDKLRYTGGKSSTSISLDNMEGKSVETVSIVYEQPYPTIIVTPTKDSYTADSPVTLSILVINGGREIKYPKIETEIYAPGMEVISSKIEELEGLEPLEKTELTEKYELEANLPRGEYIANARFREDFATLATGTGKFYVRSGVEPSGNTLSFLMILGAILVAGYVTYGKIKEIREEK